MSIWTDTGKFLSTFAADAFSTVVENIRTYFEGNAETRKRVSFSVALIALSAKMAKADGVVTPDEVVAFQEIFSVPPREFENVSRLFNLAKQDVAGFDIYGAQVRSLFPHDAPDDKEILQDVIDALFHIAKADGVIHENELLFLEEIAVVFGFNAVEFERCKMRHLEQGDTDPYFVLGADPSWNFLKLKAHYRKKVLESHPDKLIARGVPKEFIIVATNRLAALNGAWEAIQAIHGPSKNLAVVE
ncbi:MAG: molecular chaperone DjiA [Rhizobiaceae bacterium]